MDDETKQPPRIDFTTFLVSLGSSAFVHLGDAPHPETGKPEVNLPLAHQTIDLLALLREKTRGNCTPEEDQVFETLLTDLRLRYVEKTAAKGGSAG